MKTKLVSITVFLLLIGALSGCSKQPNQEVATPTPETAQASKGAVGIPPGTSDAVLADMKENLTIDSEFTPTEAEMADISFKRIAPYWRSVIPTGKVVVNVWKQGKNYAALFSPTGDPTKISLIGLAHWQEGGEIYQFHLLMVDWYRRSDDKRQKLIRAPRGVVKFQSVSLTSSGFDATAIGNKGELAHVHLYRAPQRYAKQDGTIWGGTPAGAFQTNIAGMVGYGDIIAPETYTPEEIEAALK
jgi:hypothetical protein